MYVGLDLHIAVEDKADTAAIEGEGLVERVRLKDGRWLRTDLVVMAAGIRPDAELAETAGIRINRGICGSCVPEIRRLLAESAPPAPNAAVAAAG